MMAHLDRSNREHVITVAEEGGLSAAGQLYGVPKSTARAWLQKYRRDGQVGRHGGAGFWRVSSPAQDPAFVAEAEGHPFVSARDLKAATDFPGQKRRVILRLKEAGLRA
jgi:transposase-like protein